MPPTEIGNFYKQIYNLTDGILKQSTTDKQLIKLMVEVFNTTEKEAENSISKKERSHIDCKAGCDTCCRVHVAVLKPETLIIADYLKTKHTDEELIKLKDDMAELCLDIKALDEIERIFANKPCVFLDCNGACSIYPVRPLLCRSITSADVDACVESIRMIALDQAVHVPMNIRQKSLFDTAFKAVADTMQKHGFPAKSFEITHGVLDKL